MMGGNETRFMGREQLKCGTYQVWSCPHI